MQVFWKKRLVLLGLLFHRQRDRRRTPSWQPELFAYLPALSTFSCGLCRTTEAGKHPCFVCVSPHPGLYFWCSFSFKGMSSGCSVLAQRWKSSATVWQEPQWQPTASLLVKPIPLALQSSLYNQLRPRLEFCFASLSPTTLPWKHFIPKALAPESLSRGCDPCPLVLLWEQRVE